MGGIFDEPEKAKSDGVVKVELKPGAINKLTWTEIRDQAAKNGQRLPTKEELKSSGVNNGTTDTWMPVSRADGKTDDWCEIGEHPHKRGERYFSHIDQFGETVWSRERGDKRYWNMEQNWRPSYYYAVKDGGIGGVTVAGGSDVTPGLSGKWTQYSNIDMCGQGDVEIIGDWKQKWTIEALKKRVEEKGYSAITVSSGQPEFKHAALKKFPYQLKAEHCKPMTTCCHHPCTIYIYNPNPGAKTDHVTVGGSTLDQIKGRCFKIRLVDQPELNWEIAYHKQQGADVCGSTHTGNCATWKIVDLQPDGFFRLESQLHEKKFTVNLAGMKSEPDTRVLLWNDKANNSLMRIVDDKNGKFRLEPKINSKMNFMFHQANPWHVGHESGLGCGLRLGNKGCDRSLFKVELL